MSLTLLRTSLASPVLLALACSLAACGSSDSGGGGGDTTDTGGTTADTSGTDGVASDTSKSDGTPGDGTATDTTTTTDGSGTDTASSGDTAGVECGAETCKTGEVCCVTPTDGGVDQKCAASCGDGGATLACDGPEDCPSGAASICCATLKVGGTFPSCTFESGAATCSGSCTTKIPTACPGEGTVRRCHATADCAGDSANPNCCTFSGGGATATFCVSNTYKAFATGGCAP